MLIGANANVDQARNDWATPLHMAVQKDNFEAVRALVGAGVSVDPTSKDGLTPLFWAAQEGYLDILRVLLKAGADMSMRMNANTTECGWTPLISAACAGHAVVVAELLQHGADRSTVTAQQHEEVPAGATALSVAVLKGHQDVVDLLRDSSAALGRFHIGGSRG